jgi:hypothetical protein
MVVHSQLLGVKGHSRSGLQPEPRITRTRRWSDAAKATAKFIGWGLAAILLTVIVAAFVYYVT